jgi:hypothetical protein
MSYAQVGVAGTYKPYQNLAKWYGTQSAPTTYEKAQWALDDINVYRESKGLQPLSEDVLSGDTRQPRFRLFKRIFRGRLSQSP